MVCAAYGLVALLGMFASFLLPKFGEAKHLDHACYWSDAMLPYVKCVGWPQSMHVDIVLNLWMYFLYWPFVTWWPIVYLIWYAWKARKQRKVTSSS